LNQLLTAVECGATLALQRSHLPADICRALETHRITGLAGVPPLWIQLFDARSPLPRMTLPHLRYITNTGGVFPPELVKRYRATFPQVRVFLMYGLSEAFRSTYLPPDEVDRRPGSMGKAIPRTEILVLDDLGRHCPAGTVGELVHRGPTVALGYYNDPEATARAFRPDPFATFADAPRVVYSGDLVRRDTDGFLYFVGRRDQLIKSLGHRMSPDEIEAIVMASGLVTEVVAKGVADAQAGQVVELHVVPRAGVYSQVALVSWCRREMPSHMFPKRVHVHEALPRTASGKVDRSQVGRAA
jgi:acyl-CoA synthetase (AMP-forming)/AMP-acid ligase II